jgi:hypothetical protein
MGELIAIPLSSERRAAAVLASLRRLEAEYLVTPAPADVALSWIGGLLRPRRWWGLWGIHPAVWLALAIEIGAMAIVVIKFGTVPRFPWRVPPLGAPDGVLPVGVLLGLAVGLALGLRLARTVAARQRRGRRRDTGNVTWLVSYVTREPDGSGSGRVRASVVRISLPEAAEGRLRAILERAAATAAT